MSYQPKISLRNLAEATEQEVYNQVVEHLLTQKKKSTNGASGCVYRGSEGLMCAAGCLIADSEYQEAMDTGRIENHFDEDTDELDCFEFDTEWKNLIRFLKVPDAHADLISRLQFAHDNHYPSGWPQALKDVGNRHGLSLPPILETALSAAKR